MKINARIYIAGHEDMIGSSIMRSLKSRGFSNLIVKSSSELNLTSQEMVSDFFINERPDYVFLVAGKVGSILANSKYPAEFIYYNLQIESNVIHSAWKSKVKKLLFLGSSCIYPKECPQPMKEDYLLSGKLEPTSEPYAIAKIAGIKMCQSYNSQYGTDNITVIPSDLYGRGDDYNPETGHVVAAFIARMHEAKVKNQKEFVVWGTGAPRREFLFVDDFADACIFLMDTYSSSEPINTGFGEDISIKELTTLMKPIIGYGGDIIFDVSRPDGMPRKLLDSTKIRKMNWVPSISLEEGIKKTYNWYKDFISTR